jgi:hypothetical protein
MRYFIKGDAALKEITLYVMDMSIKTSLTYTKLLDGYVKENELSRSLIH